MNEEQYIKFKEDMQGGFLEFDEDTIKHIWEIVNTEYGSIEELTESEIYHEGDFSMMYDVNLHSLIENLNDMSVVQIQEYISATYGNVIDFLYLENDGLFAMAVGAR